jgi:two-component system chemotaxis response regulator CheY
MSKKLHFLVVDDQPIARCIVVAMLNTLGYTRVTEAVDGENALQLLQTGNAFEVPISFIITDWNMPNMNGLTLLKTVRANTGLQHLPVVMITSIEEEENISAAINAGADGYIFKSNLSTNTLKVTLGNIIMRRGLVA